MDLFLMNGHLLFVCAFTTIIHMTESLAYGMRLAGIRTKKIAIALSFVTSTLLISRLSNMFQAPVLGSMVDFAVMHPTQSSIEYLEYSFRVILFAAFIGVFIGAFLTPTMVRLYEKAINRFSRYGSVPRLAFDACKPRNLIKIFRTFRLPRISMLSNIFFGEKNYSP